MAWVMSAARKPNLCSACHFMDPIAQVVFTGLGLLPLLERFRLLLFRRAVTLELSFFQAAYADRIPTWTFMTA
jgi:hypothetical protein